MKKRIRKYPVYVNHLPPCNHACPAGSNVQLWLKLVKEGKLRAAWEAIVSNNPFPASCGRVCYHFCEAHCSRASYDSTVNIHAIERFLGDTALTEKWSVPSGPATGKQVLVVGAGPAGLTAAYHLRRLGHAVTIYEALPQAGGMMLTGIPNYRLPQAVLQGEIQRILAMGVKIEFNHRVFDIIGEMRKFAAVFIAIGAHLGKYIDFPVIEPCPIVDAVSYLREVALGNNLLEQRKQMVIYGGGNTAIDVARTARRLGVLEVTIVYHRTQDKMPAFPAEIEDALEEGVKFCFLRTLLSVENSTVILGINELNSLGVPEATGHTVVLAADLVVLALGQSTDSEFLQKVPEIKVTPQGTVTVDEKMMTGYPGIFAGGDMVPGNRSVTDAIGHGKKAAYHIDAYLRNTSYVTEQVAPLVTYEDLKIRTGHTVKVEQKLLDVNKRLQAFTEVVQGITQAEVASEAQRCLSCGNCFICDSCLNACPVNAIIKEKQGYTIDYTKCIGCGKCFRTCPCHAIKWE